MNDSNSSSCSICGDAPAARVKLQSASSRIIWWVHSKVDTTLCAICAELTYLRMQERTLIQGWWGPLSAVATVVFAVGNRLRISTHRKKITSTASLDGARPRSYLHVRKQPGPVIVSLIAISIIGFAGIKALSAPPSVDNSTPSSFVGSCWANTSGGNQLRHVSCSDSSAVYEVSSVTVNAQDCTDVYIAVGAQYACMRKRI